MQIKIHFTPLHSVDFHTRRTGNPELVGEVFMIPVVLFSQPWLSSFGVVFESVAKTENDSLHHHHSRGYC